jgi:hypothetical protein
MGNLRVAMMLFGAIQIAEGAVMWLLPEQVVTTYFKIEDFNLIISSESNFLAYILAMTGAALISAGFLFIIGGFSPYKNVNAVRFAVLWSALALAAQIYAIAKEYTTFGEVWLPLVITAIFLLAFIIFFPWPWRRESYR